jgi:hypothetical protein
MTNTCWGTPHAPVETPPRRAEMYMHPRGHPLGEHMSYVSSRVHALLEYRIHGLDIPKYIFVFLFLFFFLFFLSSQNKLFNT